MLRRQPVVKIHHSKPTQRKAHTVVGVKLLGAVEPAAAMDADDGGQGGCSAFGIIDIQLVFRMLAVYKIQMSYQSLGDCQSSIPLGIAFSPLEPHFFDGFFHIYPSLSVPFRTGNGVQIDTLGFVYLRQQQNNGKEHERRADAQAQNADRVYKQHTYRDGNAGDHAAKTRHQ